MALELLYGMDQEALTDACIQMVEESSQAPCLLVLPEQYSLSGERMALSKHLTGALFRVSNFRHLAHRLFGLCGGEKASVNTSCKVMLMQDVLLREQQNLSIYGSSVEKQGTASMLCEFISECKQAEIRPSQLQEAAALLPDGILAGKLEDCARIFQSYQEKLSVFGKDTDDDLTVLADLLEEQTLPIADWTVLVDGFRGFTAQEKRLLTVLSRCCKRVVITLQTDGLEETKHSCFAITVSHIRSFLEQGATVRSIPPKQGEREESLSFLTQQYFSYPYAVYDKQPVGLQIVSTANLYEEVEMVAAQIRELCRREGMRYRQFAIVVRRLDAYRDALSQVFDAFGISYFMDDKKAVLLHPFMMFVLSIADVFAYHWSSDSIFSYMKSLFSPLSSEQADELENFSLEYGIRQKEWKDRAVFVAKLERIFSQNTEYDRDFILSAYDALTIPLQELYHKTKGKRTLREHGEELFSFLMQLQVPDRISRQMEALKEKKEHRLAEEYGQLWNLFVSVLEEAVRVLGDTTMTYPKFSDILRVGLGQHKIGVIPPVLDSVMITVPERFVGGDMDTLFLMGANEGEFPAPSEEEGLFERREWEALKQVGLQANHGQMQGALLEDQLLHHVLSAPKRRLCISYKRANAAGKAEAPSELVRRVQELFPAHKLFLWEEVVSAPVYTKDKLMKRLPHPEGKWLDALAWLQQQDPAGVEPSVLFAQEVRLSEETVQQMFEGEQYTSISALERYRRCPFSYFVQYILRAKERKVYSLEAPDLGILIHEVLEKSSRRIEREEVLSWQTLTKEQALSVAKETTQEVMQSMAGGSYLESGRYAYLMTKLQRLLAKNLFYISAQFKNGSFQPMGYELQFSEYGNLPPITLYTEQGEKIVLQGKVDRADCYQTPEGAYIRIVDYKSSAQKLYLDDVYYGLRLQLITYADALCQDQAEPAGTLYFQVHDDFIRGDYRLDAEELQKQLIQKYKMSGLLLNQTAVLTAMDQEMHTIPAYLKQDGTPGGSVVSKRDFVLLRRHIRKTIRELAGEIQRGVMDVYPVVSKRENACRYCKFSSICSFEKESMSCCLLQNQRPGQILAALREEATE